MSTLLLRLSAPIQAWGNESKYDIRQTWMEPSKSGVIGMLSAALGERRDSNKITVLSSALRMGVRVDMPGSVIRDFHTARPPKYSAKGELRHEADGSIIMENAPYVTSRYYLCDACFLIGLESDDESLLSDLAEALLSPCFPLYLGRRSCPPTQPLCLGIRNYSLKEALQQEPWQAPEWYRRHHPVARLRMIIESPKGTIAYHSLRDEPVSFSPIHRRYSYRGIEREQFVLLGNDVHDPMSEL